MEAKSQYKVEFGEVENINFLVLGGGLEKEEKTLQIMELYRQGVKQSELARQFGLSRQRIHRIINRPYVVGGKERERLEALTSFVDWLAVNPQRFRAVANQIHPHIRDKSYQRAYQIPTVEDEQPLSPREYYLQLVGYCHHHKNYDWLTPYLSQSLRDDIDMIRYFAQ